jgi:hypothetical protein
MNCTILVTGLLVNQFAAILHIEYDPVNNTRLLHTIHVGDTIQISPFDLVDLFNWMCVWESGRVCCHFHKNKK